MNPIAYSLETEDSLQITIVLVKNKWYIRNQFAYFTKNNKWVLNIDHAIQFTTAQLAKDFYTNRKKIIEYKNFKFEVPHWVNYISMDGDGQWFGYELEPYICDISFGVDKGKCEQIYNSQSINWKDTLTKV